MKLKYPYLVIDKRPAWGVTDFGWYSSKKEAKKKLKYAKDNYRKNQGPIQWGIFKLVEVK